MTLKCFAHNEENAPSHNQLLFYSNIIYFTYKEEFNDK